MDKATELLLLNTTSILHAYCGKRHIRNATCFFVKDDNEKVYLVTNNHVVRGATSISITITFRNVGIKTIDIKGKICRHLIYDLCIIDFTDVYNKATKAWGQACISFITQKGIASNFESFNRIEEIFMVGYPGATHNEEQNLPLVRKGITASGLCDKYENKDIFVVDMPTFWGSSGSPIYIFDEDVPILVGIIFKTYLKSFPIYQNRMYHKKYLGKIEIPNDLGEAIKSNVLLELIGRMN